MDLVMLLISRASLLGCASDSIFNAERNKKKRVLRKAAALVGLEEWLMCIQSAKMTKKGV